MMLSALPSAFSVSGKPYFGEDRDAEPGVERGEMPAVPAVIPPRNS